MAFGPNSVARDEFKDEIVLAEINFRLDSYPRMIRLTESEQCLQGANATINPA